MAIVYTPKKRFSDPDERVTDLALDLLSQGTAIVEPETIGTNEIIAADVIAQIAVIPTGANQTNFQTAGAHNVPGNSSILLTDSPTAPAGATIDSVVGVVQKDGSIYYTGYIDSVAGEYGAFIQRVRIIAHNLTPATVIIGTSTLLTYSVFIDTRIKQPISPNLALSVIAGRRWYTFLGDKIGLPVTVANLNATALPVVNIPQYSVTAIELESDTIRRLASKNTGKRNTFTVPTTTAVPVGAAVYLGVSNFSGGSETIVAVGQLGATPLFTGYVSSSNGTTIVSIYARNNSITPLSVAAGTQLKVLIL